MLLRSSTADAAAVIHHRQPRIMSSVAHTSALTLLPSDVLHVLFAMMSPSELASTMSVCGVLCTNALEYELNYELYRADGRGLYAKFVMAKHRLAEMEQHRTREKLWIRTHLSSRLSALGPEPDLIDHSVLHATWTKYKIEIVRKARRILLLIKGFVANRQKTVEKTRAIIDRKTATLRSLRFKFQL